MPHSSHPADTASHKVDAAFETLRKNSDHLNGVVPGLTKKVTDLEVVMKKLQSTVEGIVNKPIGPEVEDLLKRLKDVLGYLEGAQKTIEGLDKRVSTLEGGGHPNPGPKSELEKRVDSLEKSFADIKNFVEAQGTMSKDLVKNLSDLQKVIDDLNTQLGKVKDDIENITLRLDDLDTELEQVKDDNVNLTKRVGGLEADLKKKGEDLDKVIGDNVTLKSRLDKLDENLKSFSTRSGPAQTLIWWQNAPEKPQKLDTPDMFYEAFGVSVEEFKKAILGYKEPALDNGVL